MQTNFWINLHHFLYVTARARRGFDANRPVVTKALEDTVGFGTLPPTMRADWDETLAYYGALYAQIARRLDKADPAKQKADFDKSYELLTRAEKIAPRHGAVVSVTSASYLDLPESYGMAPHVIEQLEGMRKGMGPMFEKFSHHGRQRVMEAIAKEKQRLLLTLGRAYAATGQPEKARANFDEALAINQESTEANLLKTELAKLAPKP